MVGKLEMVGLYEYNDVYQVIDSTNSVLFQGSKANCKKYVKKRMVDKTKPRRNK